ncbi:immunoglobulin-like and fibronectin type III domain-containing protein 1 [Eucyclogobius newberryi]|uniref:immunoglobulin-like and fibronectin type III domain-containing protein 1 n=1 Tax=Eucyclogobius newberryi TaxID=166745 RepID=UPI003B5A6D07
MWKKPKSGSTSRKGFSLVHRYIQHFNEVSGNRSASIRRLSKIPGVTITQYVSQLPEGKTHPDFQSKPEPVNTKEGKVAVFKAVVVGEPKPEVTWSRITGNISNKEKYQTKYNEVTREHMLEILNVRDDDVDTYKCIASNEFGKAMCTAALQLTEVLTNPLDFRKFLRKIKLDNDENETGKYEAEEDRFWNAMLKANKKDYKKICDEYGVADLHLVVRKLEEKRRERAKKESVMFSDEDGLQSPRIRGESNEFNTCMDQFGDKHTELYCEDDGNLSPELLISSVDFVIKIQAVKAHEREDALFECVLTQPLHGVTWMGENCVLEESDKYSISVSSHKLIHRLLIRDCINLDKGIYSVKAGPVSCSALLVVEDDPDPASTGKVKPRKSTVAGGSMIDIEKVAKDQQIKIQKEMERILAAHKAKQLVEQRNRDNQRIKKVKDGRQSSVTTLADTNGSEATTGHTQQSKSKKKDKNRKLKGSTTKTDETETDGPRENNKKNTTQDQSEQRTGINVEFDEVRSSSEYLQTSEESESETESDSESESESDSESESESKESEDEEIDENYTEDNITSVRNPNQIQQKSHKSGTNKMDRYEDEEIYEEEGEDENRSSTKSNKKSHHRNHINDNDINDANFEEDSNAENKVKTVSKKGLSKKTKKKNRQGKQETDQATAVPDYEEEEDVNNNNVFKKVSSKDRKKHQRSHLESVSEVCLTSDPDKQDDRGEENSEDSNHFLSTADSKHGQILQNSAQGETGVTGKKAGTKKHKAKGNGSATSRSKRKQRGRLIEDVVIDPGVHFIWGLSDVDAVIGESAELTCKLSREDCEGAWFRDGKKISHDDNFTIFQDGVIHTLVITKCEEEHSGKYRFEAGRRKTEAMVNVKDPPRFVAEHLEAFTQPVTIKVGHNAVFKLAFVGHLPIKIHWYREEEELHEDTNIKIEKSSSHSCLLLIRSQRKDTGEIKIKLKNEDGFTEAISQLIVLDKPTCPLGPAEVIESSPVCIEFKWRPPKDDGGSPVTNYTLERQQVGRNTWKKLGEMPGVPCYRDTDVDHGRKYCYRIRAVTAEGASELLETDDIQAGTLAFPGPPAPPKIIDAYDDCINLEWVAPKKTGGSRILGYVLEKRKKGSNLWSVVNHSGELIKEKKFAVKDVVSGLEYEFRVAAVNLSGPGECSNPSEFVCARDPKMPPGRVTALKVTETSYTHFALTWTKPVEREGVQDEAKGYFIEIRNADSSDWSRCNSTPMITTSYCVKGLRSMNLYWVRVIAVNDGGESPPEELPNYVMAMPLPVRPKFTNQKMKSFIVVRAGNSVRITVHFEASPRPDIMWLKDNVPVTKRVTVSNCDGSSQLLIPSSERSDSGIYSILVKNLVGQETLSTEVRVTDDPKPPGPVELEENVPGTLTVVWEPSPDEKRDDRLHYTVSKLDSTKNTWTMVADQLFNNRFTVCNIMEGREYHFRVYAKNDMGISAPSESPTWGREKKREKFVVSLPSSKDCDLRCAPTFIVPLKLHTAPKGYECYMSCAVTGNPKPRIIWYRNNISLNTNTNYYISNTCGVCSMLILQVGPKDMGEFVVTAENALGRAESATVLCVRE